MFDSSPPRVWPGRARAAPGVVLGLWVVLLVLGGHRPERPGDALTNQDNFTNKPESVQAEERLEERLRGERPLTETVIVRSAAATVDDEAFRVRSTGFGPG